MLRRIALLLFAVMVLTSCKTLAPAPGTDSDFTRVELEDLPDAVRQWAEDSQDMQLVHTKVYQDRKYILANYGELPSEGYVITIEDVKIGEDIITVTIDYAQPNPGDAVPEEITYPQDIVYIADSSLPIEYAATDGDEYVPTLVGIEELPKIIPESSQFIKVFSPASGSSVSSVFSVEGVGNVFEGSISYRVVDADGNPGEEKIAMAGMGDWYYFRADVDAPEAADFTLELYTYSAKDSSIINLVSIPLTTKQAGN